MTALLYVQLIIALTYHISTVTLLPIALQQDGYRLMR